MLGSWKKVQLFEIAQIERGRFSARPRNDPQFYGGEIPFIQTGDISRCNGILKDWNQTLNNKGLRVSKLSPKGSLAITIAANIGDVAEIEFSFACPDSLVIIQPFQEINVIWLKHMLINAKSYFRACATQNAQANINLEVIKPLTMTLPPIQEQKAIAAILSTWDEAIEKTERLIRSKSELILGVTQKIIGSQCKHWRHINIEDMFTCVSEKKYPNEDLLSVTQDQGVIPRSMLEGRVMSPQGSTEAYKLIVPGDFVVSLRSFQGGIEYSKYRGLISPAYTVLRPKVEIHVEFYTKFFKTNLFIEKYLSVSVIGIRDGKQISIPDLLITKIPLLSLQEQKKIALLLDNYTNELDLLKELLNKYKAQKQGLMQKLLTGKWRVNFKEEK